MSCSIDRLKKLAKSRYNKIFKKENIVVTIGTKISVVGGLMLNAFWMHIDGYGLNDDTGS